MIYIIYLFKFGTSTYLINEGKKAVALPQYGRGNFIGYSKHNVQISVGNYFSIEQKYIQYFHMPKYAEYMEKLPKISI